MSTFSRYFRLPTRLQHALDFVDVPVNEDLPLFIDPFAISLRPERWSQDCSELIQDYFQMVLEAIRKGNLNEAARLLSHLGEPNETHFGFSKGKPRGAGIGGGQAGAIVQALSNSEAVKTGLITSISECELLVEGISHDKISDLTTNVIRKQLAEYTKQQCDLWGVPTQEAPLPPYFDSDSEQWESSYHPLPIVNHKPILLVPKIIARYKPGYDSKSYYQHVVLNYLQTEHLKANSSLVHVLKNGKRVVTKKALSSEFPWTKAFLTQVTNQQPDLLKEYEKRAIAKDGFPAELNADDETWVATTLSKSLQAIQPGRESADAYHNLMIAILEFLFHPNLLNPKKEKEIHDGRKRIDIMMENGARRGIFYDLHSIRKIPCSFVPIECKNFRTDVANPEIDQLSGRFSAQRGRVGLLCCRSFENRTLFIKRCRDTLTDDRGLVVALDDERILALLLEIRTLGRTAMERLLASFVNEVW